MAEVRHEVHDQFGNLFNVRPYKLSFGGTDKDTYLLSRTKGSKRRGLRFGRKKRSSSPKRGYSPTRGSGGGRPKRQLMRNVSMRNAMDRSRRLELNSFAALGARKDE